MIRILTPWQRWSSAQRLHHHVFEKPNRCKNEWGGQKEKVHVQPITDHRDFNWLHLLFWVYCLANSASAVPFVIIFRAPILNPSVVSDDLVVRSFKGGRVCSSKPYSFATFLLFIGGQFFVLGQWLCMAWWSADTLVDASAWSTLQHNICCTFKVQTYWSRALEEQHRSAWVLQYIYWITFYLVYLSRPSTIRNVKTNIWTSYSVP